MVTATIRADLPLRDARAQRCCCCSAAASSPPRSSRDSKGDGGGWLLINFGWGLGVFAGVYVAFPSGAHLNPAVTAAQLIDGQHHLRPVAGSTSRRVPRCLHRCRARLAGLQAALRRRGRPGHEARRVLHRAGHPQLRLEHRRPRSSAPSC